jgi:AraC-like DNA-binding protein
MQSSAYIPCDELKPYIRAFLIQEVTAGQPYKVLPDTGLVLGFQFRGRISHLSGEKEILLATAGITGLRDRFRLFKQAPDTGTVLVFFKEAGAVPFFREPLHELFRESISLDHFMLRSELLILEEQLCTASTDEKKVAVVEQFLVGRMRQTPPDQLVLTALSLIHRSKGTIRIKELAKHLHTSQSPLEKRFRQAVGASPKKFAAIVRMKNTILLGSRVTSLTELGYEAGFYDQAHFIKEFKALTGDTPGEFFLRED